MTHELSDAPPATRATPAAERGADPIALAGGLIEYRDTGGADRPTLVFVHGLLMDGTLWDGVVADLAVDHRCVVPTLPLGAHRHPMQADADLSLRGVTHMLAELLDRSTCTTSRSSATTPVACSSS